MKHFIYGFIHACPSICNLIEWYLRNMEQKTEMLAKLKSSLFLKCQKKIKQIEHFGLWTLALKFVVSTNFTLKSAQILIHLKNGN